MRVVVSEGSQNTDPQYSDFLRRQSEDPDWRAWLKILAGSLNEGDKVAEYGAGFGNIAIPISREGVRYTAYDINPIAIEHMLLVGGEFLRPILRDVAKSVEEIGEFKCIVIRSCLLNVMSVEQRNGALRSAFSELVDSGVLYVEVFDENWLKSGVEFSNEYQTAVAIPAPIRNRYRISVVHPGGEIIYEQQEDIEVVSRDALASTAAEFGWVIDFSIDRSPLTRLYGLIKKNN